MEKIRCLFIDDQVKRIKKDIDEWKRFSSEENLGLFNSFIFEFKQSDVKTVVRDLIDECRGYDFIVLDQMAVNDEAGTQLAEGIGGDLNRENINYCIYTNQVGQATRAKFEKVNIYKKSEIVEEEFKIEHNCDGGFLDMLNHIKDNTGFNKYCRFLRFTNNQSLEDLIRTKLADVMINYLESGECKPIDNGHLLKFCEFVSNELVEKEIIPDFADPFPAIKTKTSTIIRYLNFPYEFLNFWLSKDVLWTIPKQIFEEPASKDTKREIYHGHMNDIFLCRKVRTDKNDIYSIGFTANTSFFDNLGIGDSIEHTLIGQSLNTIWAFRCSDGHKGQEDPNNHALKVVYESILLVCERLSIIFERIDELDKLAVDIEEIEPVSEIKEESSNQYAAEDTHAEQAPNLTEKSEEPKKEDGVIKAKATGIGVKATGQKIDLTQFKKPENL